jgi:hypothetical protein
VIWIAAVGWASFFVLGIIWLTKGSPDRIIAEEQKKVMHAQSTELKRQQKIIDKLTEFYHTLFHVEKFKLGARLAAEGRAELIAIHPNPRAQAEAQEALDEVVRLLKEGRKAD